MFVRKSRWIDKMRENLKNGVRYEIISLNVFEKYEEKSKYYERRYFSSFCDLKDEQQNKNDNDKMNVMKMKHCDSISQAN